MSDTPELHRLRTELAEARAGHTRWVDHHMRQDAAHHRDRADRYTAEESHADGYDDGYGHGYNAATADQSATPAPSVLAAAIRADEQHQTDALDPDGHGRPSDEYLRGYRAGVTRSAEVAEEYDPADQAAAPRESTTITLPDGETVDARRTLLPDDGVAHVVADASDDPEHVDDCPGCEPRPGDRVRVGTPDAWSGPFTVDAEGWYPGIQSVAIGDWQVEVIEPAADTEEAPAMRDYSTIGDPDTIPADLTIPGWDHHEIDRFSTAISEDHERLAWEHASDGRRDVAYTVFALLRQLHEARNWARHGYEIGQRSCTWSDHGVAPHWLTDPTDTEEADPR